MCFNQEMSGAFAAVGFAMAYYVHSRTSNTRLAAGIFYFFVMEFLQFLSYSVIDDCDNRWNKLLTLLGYLHICFQPFFCHLINSSLTMSKKYLTQYDLLLKLCLAGGVWLFSRHLLADFYTSTPITSDFTDWSNGVVPAGSYRTTEWLRGETLCTFAGRYHLAWSVPMADVSYWIPAASIHSFLMFAPFFVMKGAGMALQGTLLLVTGPVLAEYVTPNLMESASIWCFFSILQISLLLVAVRDVLLVRWGRSKEFAEQRSIFFGSKAADKKETAKAQ